MLQNVNIICKHCKYSNIAVCILSPQHGYSVAGVEKGADGKEYVVLVNPRNSGEKIKISRESFMEYLDTADAIANDDNTLQVDEPKLILDNLNLPKSL